MPHEYTEDGRAIIRLRLVIVPQLSWMKFFAPDNEAAETILELLNTTRSWKPNAKKGRQRLKTIPKESFGVLEKLGFFIEVVEYYDPEKEAERERKKIEREVAEIKRAQEVDNRKLEARARIREAQAEIRKLNKFRKMTRWERKEALMDMGVIDDPRITDEEIDQAIWKAIA